MWTLAKIETATSNLATPTRGTQWTEFTNGHNHQLRLLTAKLWIAGEHAYAATASHQRSVSVGVHLHEDSDEHKVLFLASTNVLNHADML